MKIVADENIPFVREIFGPLGDVLCVSGRQMSADVITDADVLLVRSVTKVNERLLSDSSVRFVGTATIGTDHVDQEYLSSREITFVSAAGSNSNSVAEYVITAILVLAEKYGWELQDKTLGIIGVGNIGSNIEKKAPALGLKVLPNDPPLQRETGDKRFVSLARVLEEADIITCHVPLTRSGPDATWHLFDREKLGRLGPGTVLINSSRGAVVDNESLKEQLKKGKSGPVVLDVWENEPGINTELLDQVAIGTPHIAGYSLDGKVNGSVMLYQKLCKFLGTEVTSQIDRLLPTPPVPTIELDVTGKTDQQLLAQAMTRIYDIMGDDGRLREITTLTNSEKGRYFDDLRKNYPVRREAFNTRIKLQGPADQIGEKLTILGFKT